MEITGEQANLLSAYKAEVLHSGFSCRSDRVAMAAACGDFYREILQRKEPRVFIVDGPDEALSLLDHLLGKFFSQKHADLIDQSTLSESISLRKETDRSVFNLAKMAKENLKEKLGIERFREVRNMIFRDLNFQFSQSVYALIEQSIQKRWKGQGRNIAEFSAHPSFADRDWLLFYLACTSVLGTDANIPSSYENLLNAGLFSGYFYDSFAILVPMPERLLKNENLVLHGENEAAVTWSDHSSLAYWNGVEVPVKLITESEKITATDILSETNAEVRRCYQEKLGSERFGNLLGLVELDKKKDRFNNEQILYRTREADKFVGDFIYFAKVVCPSTGRNYFLCVPSGLSSVEEAVSWTFGKSPGDYRPSIET